MLKPYYEDEWATIYHGSAMDVWPQLPEAALVLTDVPYNFVNRADSGLRSLDRGDADALPVDCAWVAAMAARSLSAYVWCGYPQLGVLQDAMAAAGMSTRSCVWSKSNPSPMNGEHLWLSSIELCAFGRRKGATFNEMCKGTCWTGPTEPRDDHPTAKPLWLFNRLIQASSDPGQLVVDPFMGSGTTVRAAKDLGRRVIGVEINEAYCELAVRRLAQEVLDFGVG